MERATKGITSARIVAGVTVVGFVATLAMAARLLPEPIDMYYGPVTRGDVEYQIWQYLAVTAAVAVVLALVLGFFGAVVYDVLLLMRISQEKVERRPAWTWVVAWTLLCFTGETWLTVWLGNDHPELRSTLAYPFAAVLLGGTAFVVWWFGWVVSARDNPRPTQRRRRAS